MSNIICVKTARILHARSIWFPSAMFSSGALEVMCNRLCRSILSDIRMRNRSANSFRLIKPGVITINCKAQTCPFAFFCHVCNWLSSDLVTEHRHASHDWLRVVQLCLSWPPSLAMIDWYRPLQIGLHCHVSSPYIVDISLVRCNPRVTSSMQQVEQQHMFPCCRWKIPCAILQG